MASDLKPVYLLTGSDRPKIELALERLRARFPPEAIERYYAPETSGEDVAAACNALGLFGGGERLVLVDAVDGIQDEHGRRTKGWKAADVKALESYLSSPAAGTVVALVAEELKDDAPLVRACAAAGEVLAYDVSKRDLPKWVRERFVRAGAAADDEPCRILVQLVGDDLTQAALEVDKLVAWAAGDPIEERDVVALVAPSAPAPSFELTDAWGRRDVAAVLAAAEKTLERASDVRRELSRLVAVLAAHVDRVRACAAMAAEGMSARDGAKALKRHEFYVRKLFAQAENFTLEELRDVVVRLARLDLALKGGSKLPGELELQLALVDITAPREAQAGTRP